MLLLAVSVAFAAASFLLWRRVKHLSLVVNQALSERDEYASGSLSMRQKLSQVESQLAEAEAHKVRLDRHNQALADAAHALQNERNDWRELYHQALDGSSGAQALLVAALQRCRAELTRNGLKIPAETGLDRVLEAAAGQPIAQGIVAPPRDQAR